MWTGGGAGDRTPNPLYLGAPSTLEHSIKNTLYSGSIPLSQVVGAVIGSATWPAPNALCVEEMALPFNLNPPANNPPLYEQML